MKQYIKILQSAVLGLLLLAGTSCEKYENKLYFEGGTAPVLTGSTNAVRLTALTENETAITLRWTNPEYKFTSGVSSANVTYTLEIDTTGANFTSGRRYVTTIASDLTKTFTEKELNAILGNDMRLTFGRLYTMQARVTASLAQGATAAVLASNVFSFTARPFAPPPKVEPPTDGTLWLVGDALASGWSNPLPGPFDVSQKCTKVTDTEYRIDVTFNAGGAYKLIQTQGVWGTQYHMITGGTALSGTFEKRDADPAFPSPGAGNYRMTYNFQTGEYSGVKL